jgi:hypothetical protein
MVAGEEVAEVAVRRPTWEDQEATGYLLSMDIGEQGRACHALIPRLTRLGSAVKNLDTNDVTALIDVITGFTVSGSASSSDAEDDEDSADSPPT